MMSKTIVIILWALALGVPAASADAAPCVSGNLSDYTGGASCTIGDYLFDGLIGDWKTVDPLDVAVEPLPESTPGFRMSFTNPSLIDVAGAGFIFDLIALAGARPLAGAWIEVCGGSVTFIGTSFSLQGSGCPSQPIGALFPPETSLHASWIFSLGFGETGTAAIYFSPVAEPAVTLLVAAGLIGFLSLARRRLWL